MEYKKSELIKTINTAIAYRDTALLYASLEELIYHEDNTKRIIDTLNLTSSQLFEKILKKQLTWGDVSVILKESNLVLHEEVK